MNMISLTSNSQLNEIKLVKCSIRTMKSATQTCTAAIAWIKQTPAYKASSLDCWLDCFLIKQEGAAFLIIFMAYFLHLCLSLPWQQKKKKLYISVMSSWLLFN